MAQHGLVVVQVSFLAYAFGGGVGHQLNFQHRYKGRDLAFMHSHMVEKGLTMDHFDSVLRHFCQTLRQLNMPQVGFVCSPHLPFIFFSVLLGFICWSYPSGGEQLLEHALGL